MFAALPPEQGNEVFQYTLARSLSHERYHGISVDPTLTLILLSHMSLPCKCPLTGTVATVTFPDAMSHFRCHIRHYLSTRAAWNTTAQFCGGP